MTDIDGDIRRLVDTMNSQGLRTYASCQGHGYPVDRRLPYVAFTGAQQDAANLARYLREDAESVSPELRWGWDVTASFNSHYDLCFRLSPTVPHHWWGRYCRRYLRLDFDQIGRWLTSAGHKPGYGVNDAIVPQHPNGHQG